VFVRGVGEALGCGARGVALGCWQCIFFGPSRVLFLLRCVSVSGVVVCCFC